LLSRSGIIPIAKSQDTAGPIGRTVEDVALLLGAMAAADKNDAATQLKRRRAYRDYSKLLSSEGLQGARLGVARNMLGSDERINDLFDSCIDIMKQKGAVIIDPANLPNSDNFGETEVEVLLYEYKYGLNAYLRSLGPGAPVQSLEDIIKFNEENKDRVMPYFGQERMTAAQKKGSLSSKKYRKALSRNRRLTRREGIDDLIKRKKLDAIVVVSGGPAWLIDMANGDPRSWDMESTSPAAVAGYPHITVPAGYLFGLPIGISFFSRAWTEPTLLRIAHAFEQAAKARKPPEFLPDVVLPDR
jgi:amidase